MRCRLPTAPWPAAQALPVLPDPPQTPLSTEKLYATSPGKENLLSIRCSSRPRPQPVTLISFVHFSWKVQPWQREGLGFLIFVDGNLFIDSWSEGDNLDMQLASEMGSVLWD